MIDWKKHPVECEHCGSGLMRRLWWPRDNKRIARFFCNTTCKGIWQRAQKSWSDEWLYQKYEVEKLSANDIAEIVGRDPKRVWEWLRGAGIKTRERGANESAWFKKGHKLCVGREVSESQREKLRDARKRDGAKGLFRNGQHVLKGRVGKDHPRFKGGLTPERQSFYASDAWKEACKIVWARADAKCERCSLDHRTIDRAKMKFNVHHIVSFQVRRLRAVPSNLMLLCEP